MQIDLSGRVAIVTGAAHGFGQAIALALGRCGASVWAVDLLADELAETAALAQAENLRCETAVCDVGDSGAVGELASRVLAAEGRIDILVNNAGGVVGQVGRPVEEVGDDDWARVLRVNLDGAFFCIRAAAPAMKSQRYGRIVNISSGAGRSFSLTGIQAYASAKAGQIGLTRQMAKELGGWNITVNNIAPGFVRSNPATERQWQAMGAERQQALVDGLALKRLGSPDDIANGVLFFVSDMAGWVTGQTLSIDGGSFMA
ncbi:MAG TPA: SDR family oxidoreductase [Roseiflexaceae bacterium]|nr:SDR family oxidoreductase [Roseiflexaceae bacterium]